MSLPDTTETLIVGAGPTGLALATALARQGAPFVLVDRQAEGANTSRAAVVHARTLEMLEPLGVVEEMLATGIRMRRFHLMDRDRALLTGSFDEVPSTYNFMLAYPQNRTEAVLLARLHALGRSVVRPAALQHLALAPDGACAQIAWDGAIHTLSARHVVGCDGLHSAVREAAGIGFAGGDYGQGFALADVHLDWPLPPDELTLFLPAAGLLLVSPLPGGHFRIVAMADDAPAEPDAAYVQHLLDARGPRARPATVRDVVWSSRFHVHHRLAATPWSGPVLLCGDAAHVHSPAGGQGMNTGIQDAIALADVLARGGQPAALEAWAQARHKVAADVVAMTDAMTRLGTIESPLGRLLRNSVIAAMGHVPAIARALARRMSEIDNG